MSAETGVVRARRTHRRALNPAFGAAGIGRRGGAFSAEAVLWEGSDVFLGFAKTSV